MRGVLMYCFNRVVSHVLAETHVFAEVMSRHPLRYWVNRYKDIVTWKSYDELP